MQTEDDEKSQANELGNRCYNIEPLIPPQMMDNPLYQNPIELSTYANLLLVQ